MTPANEKGGGRRVGQGEPRTVMQIRQDPDNLGRRSASCQLEEPHVGRKWPGLAPPVHSRCLRIIQEERGFSWNAEVAPEGATAGG